MMIDDLIPGRVKASTQEDALAILDKQYGDIVRAWFVEIETGVNEYAVRFNRF